MTQEIEHFVNEDPVDFQDKMNEAIEYRSNRGWELTDTDLSQSYDTHKATLVFTALLVFEK